MSRRNVEASIDSVERALAHFAASLERGGFAAGADAYRQMAEVIVGQWLWVEHNGERALEPAFRRIAGLAARIEDQLRPYLHVMERLRCLRGLTAERWGVQPGSTADAILDVLVATDRPLTATELRTATRVPTAELRRELRGLLERNVVTQSAGRRARFALAGRQ